MKCLQCGHTTKAEKIDRYHYAECGLKNVYLRGITRQVCASCGETEVSIPNIEQLHELIAADVASQEARLQPEEIRFLRVHLGFSGADFAKTINVTPEAVSRWENNKSQMKLPTEKLLRTLVLAKIGPFRNYEELAHFATKKIKARRAKEFSTDMRNAWHLAPAA